jgi:hypothetical protein
MAATLGYADDRFGESKVSFAGFGLFGRLWTTSFLHPIGDYAYQFSLWFDDAFGLGPVGLDRGLLKRNLLGGATAQGFECLEVGSLLISGTGAITVDIREAR